MSHKPATTSQPESELERFFDLSLDLLVIAGLDGYMKRVNPAYVRTLGFPVEQLLARPMLDVVHPDDVQSVVEVLGGLVNGEDVVAFENRVICADGSVRWLQWNTRAMPEQGIVYGVGRDVTDRRRADAELDDARRMIEASHDELRALADEQAALRRVATLVARGVPPAEVFPAVAAEVSVLLGSDTSAIVRFEAGGTVTVLGDVGGAYEAGARVTLIPGFVVDSVHETRRSARFDADDPSTAETGSIVRSFGVRSAVASPIIVEGELWGAITSASLHGPLSAQAERRLTGFTELVATAVANSQAREEVTALADVQAALRRVATLVAENAESGELFAAVAREVAGVLDVHGVIVERFEADGSQVVLGSAYDGDLADAGAFLGVGVRLPLRPGTLAAAVIETHRAARLEDYSKVDGPMGAVAAAAGIGSGCAAPIIVEGRLWGQMCVYSRAPGALPEGMEHQLDDFVKLVATAISNYDARVDVRRLADEQAALRRVATLVARGVSEAEIFASIAQGVRELLVAEKIRMVRYEDDRTALVVASSGDIQDGLPVGSHTPLDGDNAVSRVFRTGRAARIDDYDTATGPIADGARVGGIRGVVATPILVEGEVWGAMVALTTGDHPLPAETESRLGQFTELMATAIANAHSRDQLTASRARLVTAGNEARRRVVRDLHDGAQQRLVHTIVTLKLAQRSFGDGHDQAEELVAEALEHAHQANSELRELAHGILPSVLTAGGLGAGIDAVVARLKLPVKVDVPARRFPTEIEANAYFIVAEALTNVMKHSRAEHARVSVYADEEVLHVEISDDGIGGVNTDGSGIVGLSDRAAALGGQLTVDCPEGGGTLVAVTLPLSGG